MSENRHPTEDQAIALVDDQRFCEWLDAAYSLSGGWPHSHYSARRWLENECGIESLGRLATDPEAAAAFYQVVRRFALWDKNQELDL